MIWMVLLGAISLLFGVMLLASPGSLVRIGEGLNRVVNRMDDQVLKYRIGFGIAFLIAAAFLFFYAYMLGLI